jgi:prevent-host-death family protein
MERIAVSEFRANLVSVLRKVERGEVITLTSRGHEIAQIIPPDNKMTEAREALDQLRKTAIINDVLSPIEEEWKVMK